MVRARVRVSFSMSAKRMRYRRHCSLSTSSLLFYIVFIFFFPVSFRRPLHEHGNRGPYTNRMQRRSASQTCTQTMWISEKTNNTFPEQYAASRVRTIRVESAWRHCTRVTRTRRRAPNARALGPWPFSCGVCAAPCRVVRKSPGLRRQLADRVRCRYGWRLALRRRTPRGLPTDSRIARAHAVLPCYTLSLSFKSRQATSRCLTVLCWGHTERYTRCLLYE